MGGNDSSTEGQPKLILRAATVSAQMAAQLQQMLKAGSSISMTPWAPIYTRFDPSEIVMWLIAVGAVASAALWAGHDFQETWTSKYSRSQVRIFAFFTCPNPKRIVVE